MASERRSHPRFPVTCPVFVSYPDRENAEAGSASHEAFCTNLSRTSIQIECRAEVVAGLRQQRPPHVCTVRFTLPWDAVEFRFDATLVTHRRLSQHQYVLALHFRHDNPAEEQRLEALLVKGRPPVRG